MSGAKPLVIDTYGLTKMYGRVAALDDLDLKVPKNSIFGFLGPNGAGKTTTIKLLLGLIKPTSGQAKIFGHNIDGESLAIRRRVGYLAQNPRFYPHMTARETLEFKAHFFYKGPQRLIDNRINESLELVGLQDKADRPIKSFSGGEIQRLGIAQAQINYPDLLILDEPAASLDPMGRHEVLKIMSRLREHTTIFYSTHILDDVQKVSDMVAILSKGKLVAQAPIEQLLASTDGIVYSLVLEGEVAKVQAQLNELSWVSDVEVAAAENKTKMRVSVTNEEAARSALLRLVLLHENVNVLEFGQERYNLEEVFLNIVTRGTSNV